MRLVVSGKVFLRLVANDVLGAFSYLGTFLAAF